MTPTFEVSMEQGATWSATVNWYGGGVFRAPIEEIVPGYPTIIRVSSHLLPTVSETPVILSGIQGTEILNSKDTGVEMATYVDADYFSLPVSTVTCNWIPGTGEITWYKPTDLTGYIARCTFRSKWYSGVKLFELTTANGGCTINLNDASIRLNITATATTSAIFTKAYGDIEVIASNGAGAITRVARMVVTLSRETTK